MSLEDKTGVLALLKEALPEAWVASLPAFISAANALNESDLGPRSDAEYYCDRLFSLLLGHHERVLSVFSEALRSELRDVARRVIVATAPNGSVRAASLLQFIGQPEDVAFLEAHRPAEPILAEVFEKAARGLRGLQKERPSEPQ
ncbi:Hypothetical protein AA314_04420 [Archangium gephyra]|uniref:Uncharacterized protein n=1 Tax=Archangium gephyra TaxID=48 RepID=A0AAC8Q8B9_9BACT|nr:Hypothetical protein AA314_04420 [Archangium gephyra]